MMIVSIVALTHIEVDDDDGDGFKWNDHHLGHKIVRCEDWGENIDSSDSWFVDGVNAHFQIEFLEHRISVALQTEVWKCSSIILLFFAICLSPSWVCTRWGWSPSSLRKVNITNHHGITRKSRYWSWGRQAGERGINWQFGMTYLKPGSTIPVIFIQQTVIYWSTISTISR